MERNAMQALINWKHSDDRMPLVLKGAQRVGKTWLMKTLGKNHYKSYVYFNFEEEAQLRSLFSTNQDPHRIIELLSLIAGQKLLPGETLLILDEIHACPEALSALRRFREEAPAYHIIVSGRFLGAWLADCDAYPADKLHSLEVTPLTFDEFLAATDSALAAYYNSIQKDAEIQALLHHRLLQAYHHYLIIGGMPECVASWLAHKDPAKIARLQESLLRAYESEIPKHCGKVNGAHALMVLRSIVPQLAKPNEKFMYGVVREGGRARDFEEAIAWLVASGLLTRVDNVSRMEPPLSAFAKSDQFKLFLFDTGLLKAMAGIENSAVFLKPDYPLKGALTENFILQQLRGRLEVEPHYYADKNHEIDFVLQCGNEIIPVEAKSGEQKTAPAFKKYVFEHKPAYALRYSKRCYGRDGDITDLPVYLAQKTRELL